jgi:type IV pilus assembly protein PilA
MYNKLKALRENRKKGFTLVELIVVLVILAILAAVLVPALTGYIDRAKEKSIVAETRQVVMAAQTIADEQGVDTDTVDIDSVDKSKVATLAEVSADNITGDIAVTDGKVTKVVYTKSGKTCTYDTSATKTYNVEATSAASSSDKGN